MLIAPKLKSMNTSEMSSARAETERCHIAAFIGFWNVG
jgi:hypothetical protein